MAESDLAVYQIVGLNEVGEHCKLIPFSQETLHIFKDNEYTSNKEINNEKHIDTDTLISADTTIEGAQQTNYATTIDTEERDNSMQNDNNVLNEEQRTDNFTNSNLYDESTTNNTKPHANQIFMRKNFKKLYKFCDHLPQDILKKFEKFCNNIPKSVSKLLTVKCNDKTDAQACINDNYFELELFLKILFSKHIYKLLLIYNKESFILANLFKEKIHMPMENFSKGEY